MKPLNEYIDHTNLKPDASEEDIRKLCREAETYGFYAVCVNSVHVPLAVSELKGSPVKVAAVAGFPLGACSTAVKIFETDWACSRGAAEIDMVLSVGALKEGRDGFVLNDIEAVVKAAAAHGASVKVILETGLLTGEEITRACGLAGRAGAAFVKTSTGFGPGGAQAEHVALMREAAGSSMRVKASGGIRTYAAAMEMIGAGADRLGTSASPLIMEESGLLL